ncbi:hypothetical protein [Cellulomonas endometrii]|uniref:hypothetical protein n=1 Tax=Cellulomonas endometrii TaxID=3036301 RepID=UPI0024AD8923|nr:hypothetical protein [Cellulomonas endometrii]
MNNPALPAVITGVLAIAATVIAQRLARGAQREVTPAQTIANLTTRLERTEERLEESERRERLRDDYIHKLRDHISTGKKPPPPPWPDGLTT